MKLKDAKPGDVVTSPDYGDYVYVVVDCNNWSELSKYENRVFLMCLGSFVLMNDDAHAEVTIVNPEEMK